MKILLRSAAAILFFSMSANAQTLPKDTSASTPPKTVVKKIFDSDRTAIGQKIVLPKGTVDVVVTTYDIPPGAELPVHKHPWPRYAYVLSGTLTVKTADKRRSFTYKAGDFIVEMVNAWHFGANTGSDPVRLLVIDQVKRDRSNTILEH